MKHIESENSYHENTYNSPYPLRRWAQRSRIGKSLDLVKSHQGERLLDYGCGDGLFISQLPSPEWNISDIYGFEPFMDISENCSSEVFRQWSDASSTLVGSKKVDVVTCFEVLEHFDTDLQKEALNNMCSVLRPGGSIVISVPIECGLPAIPKNILRRRAWNWKPSSPDGEWIDVCTTKNILKSVFRIPVPEHRTGKDYLSHMGFYFFDLEKVIDNSPLRVIDKKFSPLSLGTHQVNSQVFYKLQFD